MRSTASDIFCFFAGASKNIFENTDCVKASVFKIAAFFMAINSEILSSFDTVSLCSSIDGTGISMLAISNE